MNGYVPVWMVEVGSMEIYMRDSQWKASIHAINCMMLSSFVYFLVLSTYQGSQRIWWMDQQRTCNVIKCRRDECGGRILDSLPVVSSQEIRQVRLKSNGVGSRVLLHCHWLSYFSCCHEELIGKFEIRCKRQI